ncbi:MAG: PIN domain-containing protein [Acidobacteria bacterium]|nr:PIN domain-containing protein [Acidobacteriota bacterium]MBV9071137.1 PIN domain-containing protein [Acidobacteriota bacterium]MBV9188054.1 PIN domain-containing protein [Acidobacteriota bacterium]
MKHVLVDANVLVSFLTDRNPAQRERAEALLRKAAAQEHNVVLHSMSIVEMIYVLTAVYREDPADVAQDLVELLAMPGVISEDNMSWSSVLERWPETIPALGDAILAAEASRGRYDAVATFDRDLAKKLVRQGSTVYWPSSVLRALRKDE